MEVENKFYFTFTGAQGVKNGFRGKNQSLSYKTNFFRKKISFHAIFWSNIVVCYYPSNNSWFFFTFTDFQGLKNLSGGKNNQILHKNNQCFQYCIFRFRPRYNLSNELGCFFLLSEGVLEYIIRGAKKGSIIFKSTCLGKGSKISKDFELNFYRCY